MNKYFVSFCNGDPLDDYKIIDAKSPEEAITIAKSLRTSFEREKLEPVLLEELTEGFLTISE